jgi:GntR family transcriptional regulator
MVRKARTVSAIANGPTTVDRASALPLWAQIHADLRRRMDEGEFAGAFPGELALVGQYQVSRSTVREALRRLRADGLVIAQRGRAPRLAVPGVITQPLGALYSLFASVEATGQVQRSIVRALDTRTDAVVAERLGMKATARLTYLERLRLADEEPLALDRIWLPAARTAALLEADFEYTALYDELADRCGIRLSGGEEQIRAVTLSRPDRALLGTPVGIAAFDISRAGYVADRPFEWRQTIVGGGRFAATPHFSAAGYQLGLAASS